MPLVLPKSPVFLFVPAEKSRRWPGLISQFVQDELPVQRRFVRRVKNSRGVKTYRHLNLSAFPRVTFDVFPNHQSHLSLEKHMCGYFVWRIITG